LIELTDRHFQDLCADDAVRRVIADANRDGRRAALGFWAFLIVGLLMVGAGTWYAIASGWLVTGVIVGSVGVLIVYILAAVPLAMAGRAIKLPVYEILAARHGLDYAALSPTPPASREAMQALFGDELATESYTDYFHGKRLDAGEFTTCQAYLLGEKGSRFSGRLFAFIRDHGSGGYLLVTPDDPSRVDPAMELIPDDPDFRCAFRVHASDAGEARALLGPEARRTLLDLRRRGKVRLYAGPGEILVALEGRKGFTPGLGFRVRRAEDRIRRMFDDLADSLAVLRSLRAALDRGP
jgi:hypothetical protein